MFTRISMVVALALLSGAASADYICSDDRIMGWYGNAAYGRIPWQGFNIQIEPTKQSPLLTFNVPCNSKVTPATFRMHPTSCISGTLTVEYEGSSQCFVGENARYILLGDALQIHVEPRIRVPGFDGTYVFHRLTTPVRQ